MKKINHITAAVALFALSFQLLTMSIQAQVCFSPATNFAVNHGDGPSQATSGDFNGDGNADLATFITGGLNGPNNVSGVSILLGDGLAGFGSASIFPLFSSGNTFMSADINNDGYSDLAVHQHHGFIVILLSNGLGGFSIDTTYDLGSAPTRNPNEFVQADFNADGKVDLASANNDTTISVLLSNNLGSFNVTTFAAGIAGHNSLTCADFNVDGKVDLATNNSNSPTISIFLGDGLGNFSVATTVTGNAYSISSGDFNGDTIPDLAFLNGDDGVSVSVMLADGSGNFGPVNNFASGIPNAGLNSLIIDDFNGDSIKDIAVSAMGNYVPMLGYTSNKVLIFLGNGNGNFGNAINFDNTGITDLSLKSADFNGDGKVDLATANSGSHNVSILLNSPPLIISSEASESTVCAGDYITLTGSGATTYSWTGEAINGVAFPSPSATTTYTLTGTTLGCSDTSTQTILVNSLPVAILTTHDETSSLYCNGSISANISGGTGIIQPQWLDATQAVLASIDSVGSLCSGAYTLHLIDSNSCTSTYTATINAGPIPQTQPICLITVDPTNTHNLLVWDRANLQNVVDSIIIYRKTGTPFLKIGAVHKDSLSKYDDYFANPNITGYRYKLATKSASGVVSDLSVYHNTIYLTNNNENFNWTPYQIEGQTNVVSNYNLYRDNNSDDNFVMIAQADGSQLGVTDINFNMFPNASYYVEAEMTTGSCEATRTYTVARSNKKSFGTAGISELNDRLIKIYPNPASTNLNITGITCKTTIVVYDIAGKLIIEEETEADLKLNISGLKEGIYTITTQSKIGKTHHKIVIAF